MAKDFIMQVKNIKHNSIGTLDMEINHPKYGWIPFHATPDDVEPHGRELYANAIAGEYGEIAPYIAPPEPTAAEVLQAKREAATLTPMQFMLNVDAAGMMPAIEAYLAEPTTPNSFKIMWNRASSFERLYPDLVSAATELGITDAQMDAIFGIA